MVPANHSVNAFAFVGINKDDVCANSTLSGKQTDIGRKYLRRRYFCPTISRDTALYINMYIKSAFIEGRRSKRWPRKGVGAKLLDYSLCVPGALAAAAEILQSCLNILQPH